MIMFTGSRGVKERRYIGRLFTRRSTQGPETSPGVVDQVLQAGVQSQRPALLVQLDKEVFTLSPGYIEVSLFPEFVALAKVTAEVVLVLHHVLWD